MTSTLITSYLGEGLLANRPATPTIDASAIGFWYSTDTLALSVYANGGWVAAGGGYSKGIPPSVVQFAHKQGNANNAVLMGSAPTNGNLLVAMSFQPTSDTASSGWTKLVENSNGTDFGLIFTKVAGAGESTTQTPVTGSPTVGATMIWELSHASGTPVFVAGLSEDEHTGATASPVLIGLATDCLGLAAMSLVTGATISKVANIGTQDVLDNTADRRIAAGHVDLSAAPNAGIFASFSGSGSSKGATAIVSAP